MFNNQLNKFILLNKLLFFTYLKCYIIFIFIQKLHIMTISAMQDGSNVFPFHPFTRHVTQ